jgi:hypothetical protein
MIPLSKNNYIRRTGHGPTFSVDLDPLPKTFDNYFIESCRAAEEIYDLKQGKIHFMYSGGVDSEYALSVFLHLGIDVTPVIVQLQPNYNVHDTKYAVDFCVDRGLKPLFIDLNYDKFVKSGKMLEISLDMKCCVPHYASTIYSIRNLDGTILMGDGEPYIRLNAETKEWELEIEEFDYSLYEYYEKYNIHGTPHFNRYTPQMMVSFLNDPRMQDLANNRLPGKLGSNSSKWMIYNRHSPFKLVERPKYHGMEIIETKEIFQHEDFKTLEKEREAFLGVWRKNYLEFMKDIWKQ